MNLKKQSNKKSKSTYEHKFNFFKWFFKLSPLIFLLWPLFLLIHTINYKVNFNAGASIITADSLITTATITLIIFTNFAPTYSSGSGSIVRRAYWRSNMTYNGMKKSQLYTWYFTWARLLPMYIIAITVFSTMGQVFIFLFCENIKIKIMIQLILFMLSVLMVFTSLTRFILFHINTNRNVSIWLTSFLSSDNKIKNINPSAIQDLLSFFRVTKNFEMVYQILDFIKLKFKEKSEKYITFFNIDAELAKQIDVKFFTFPNLDKKINEKVDDKKKRFFWLFIINLINNEDFLSQDISNSKYPNQKIHMLNELILEIMNEDSFKVLKIVGSLSDENYSNETEKPKKVPSKLKDFKMK